MHIDCYVFSFSHWFKVLHIFPVTDIFQSLFFCVDMAYFLDLGIVPNYEEHKDLVQFPYLCGLL